MSATPKLIQYERDNLGTHSWQHLHANNVLEVFFSSLGRVAWYYRSPTSASQVLQFQMCITTGHS